MENFVLCLPLEVTKQQKQILDNRFERLRLLYNDFQKKMIRHYIYVAQTDECRTAVKTTKKGKDGKMYPDIFKRKKFFSEYTVPVRNAKNEVTDMKLFTKYGFMSYVLKFKQYEHKGINTSMLEDLATNAWSAWDKRLYGDAKKVHFKKEGEYNSFTIRHKKTYFNGLVADRLKDSIITLKLGLSRSPKGYTHIPFKVKTDYEKEALYTEGNEIREIGFKRIMIHGKWKYFVTFSILGKKPQKNRKLGTGKVGIDIGPSKIAVVSDDGIHVSQLADKVYDVEKQVAKLQRKIERSVRPMNPEQYNENGTIKKFKRGEQRPKWIYSNRCLNLKRQLREEYRKQALARKDSNIELSNKLLSMGDKFIVENNSFKAMTKRSKETKTNEKTGKIKSKKRFGKSIGDHAPAMLITILGNKVTSLGGELLKINPKYAATQFDFTNGEFTKHELKERKITLSNGRTHDRDIIAAFNIQNVGEKPKEYNVDEMKEKYERFCVNEEIVLKRKT